MGLLMEQLAHERDHTAARLAALEPFQGGAEQTIGSMARLKLQRVNHYLMESTAQEEIRYQGASEALAIAKTLIYTMEIYRANDGNV